MDYPKRKNPRLKKFDYSQNGGYFITICTNNRADILSRILNTDVGGRARVELSELGFIVDSVLRQMSGRGGVRVDSCVIMPNHIHMILLLENEGETGRMTIGSFIGGFKSVVANLWRKECNVRGVPMGKLWQRDYYDHVLRNEADYLEKLKYIDENPDKWREDKMYVGKEKV